jgi:predicted SnoaL-like aldol condensation-catalyzing enzyme
MTCQGVGRAEFTESLEELTLSQKLENARNLYLEGIRDGNAREAVTQYTGAWYTQHSTGVKDGVEGFVEFFEPFIARNPKRDIQIVRALEDGPYVFLHVYQSLDDGEAEWVTTDFFETDEDGKIIEHWDVISEYAPQTPSGHTTIDGPTEVVDLEKTEENKQLVRDLIRDVLMKGGNPQNIDTYISDEQYIQHNADVPDGLEHFRPLALAEDKPLVYEEIVLLIGQGNFVATLCKASWEDQPLAQVDIFRIENGKIVEHWDNAEPVPPEEEWANSGKF